MKKVWKIRKILALIVTVCVAIEFIVVPGGAQKVQAAVASGDYEYVVLTDASTIRISKYIGSWIELGLAEVVKIPKTIDEKSVVEIGDHVFENQSELIKVIIPGSVTSIGSYVFAGCENMEEAVIGNSMASIGENAFAGCAKLTEITIPSSVKSIGNFAFKDCKALSKVYYVGTQEQWENLGVGETTGNEALQNATIEYVSITEDEAANYYEYEHVNIGSDNESIRITKYIGADSNKIADIPKNIGGWNVTGIGQGAFLGCTGLEEINIPDNITSIEESVFDGCIGLKKATIPDSVLSIKKNAFRGCTGLCNIYYSGEKWQWEEISTNEETDLTGNEQLCRTTIHYAGVTEYVSGDYRYQYMGDGTIGITKYNGTGSDVVLDVPEEIDELSVTGILGGAFSDCVGLKEITIPDCVESIEGFAFQGCTSLREITIPSSMEYIGWNVFYGCTALSDMYYSGTVTQWEEIRIDPTVKEQLSEITIHYVDEYTSGNYKYKILDDGIIEIVKYAGADSNTVADIPGEINGASVVSIGRHAFEGCANIKKVIMPDSVASIDSSAFQSCTGLAEINIRDNVTSIGGAAFEGCSNLGKITIPNGVTNIRGYTFHGCSSLAEINLPDSVTVIGSGAFELCTSLKEIAIPDSMTQIGFRAFFECTSLEKINIPDSVKNIVSVAFGSCTSLTEVMIPDGVTGLQDYVFGNCKSLQKITIPASITEIGKEAFDGCTALSDIYYPGTEEQWNKIKISRRNEPLQNATVHYNYVTKTDIPEEPKEEMVSAKQALEGLKAGDALSLDPAFQPYLSPGQIDIMESYLYTWLAEANCAYQYSSSSGAKERMMKKAGIDPEGDFASGKEQAITHITVDTKYGKKTFEITLDLGKPDGSGNLYPAYGAMHYELLQKEGVPADVTKSGQIGKSDYVDIGTFAQCVSKAAEDSLHGTYQWQSLSDEMTAGVLADKTITEIIGNKNGSFSDGTFTIYEKPLVTYSKKITVTCRAADVRVFTMDGKDVGAIVGGQANEKDEHVSLHVEGDTKTIFLSGNDYYLNLRGTGTGTMNYKVEEYAKLEEPANEEVRRTVQILEQQLEEDLQYEGYVFRPLNIDSGLYALHRIDGPNKEAILPTEDTYESIFKKVKELTLSHGEAALDQNRSIQLSASLVPLDASNQSLRWTTSNQSVLSVDGNGLVTAVGAGSATVTVSTKDGSFIKQYCVINVKGGGSSSGGTGGSGSSGGTGGSGSSGGTSGSGSSGNIGGYGNGTNGPGGSGNNSDNSGYNPDDSKPSLEPETPPVVVALNYVLQFQANGGVNLSRRTMTLLADDNPGIMPKIQRKGYVFNGWYTQQYGGEQVTGDEPLKAAATLYAHWTKAEAPNKILALTLKSKKKGQMRISFKRAEGAAGYQLQYSANKDFTSKKMKQLGASAKAQTVSGLKAGKKYYARVRAYSVDSMGNKMYGKYSKAKSVKVKS